MHRIWLWIKSWLTPCTMQKADAVSPLLPPANADFYQDYFSLIADGARLRLVEAMFNLNLFALFADNLCVLERDIIEKLALMPVRAQKWLHLLSCEHFLIKIPHNNQTAYQLPPEWIVLMRSEKWKEITFFFSSWGYAARENLSDVLCFGQAKLSVAWPPQTDAEVCWLENWMAQSAAPYIECILTQINWMPLHAILDVGGGDGTIACALVSAHSHLKASVYNLKKTAQMARNLIAEKNLTDKISVIEGDFIKETDLPKGFDLILFSRVMLDWDEQVNRKLLQMAYQALPPKGLVAICEFYKEENHDKCLAREYRYLFHDDFAVNVFKYKGAYLQMLEETGFQLLPTREETSLFPECTLILAQK